MAHYKVPGVAVAVLKNGRVVAAASFGVREAACTMSWMPARFSVVSIRPPVDMQRYAVAPSSIEPVILRTPSRFSRDGWVFEFKYDESPDLEGVTSQVLK